MNKTQKLHGNTIDLWNKLDFMQQYRAIMLQSDIEERIRSLISYYETPRLWRVIKESTDTGLSNSDVDNLYSQVLALAQIIQVENMLDKEYAHFIEHKTFSTEITSTKVLIESYIQTIKRPDSVLATKLLEKQLGLFFFEYFLKDKNNLTALLKAKEHKDNLPLLQALGYH